MAMKNQITLHRLGRGTCLCIRRESFTVGNARLVVQDMIPVFRPWRGTRIMRISGTNAFYSEVPLCPLRHELLCYTYCADTLKHHDPGFYRHALVLGCGGGSIPRWLLDEYPSVSVDVVDYSPEIIAVSQKYFLKKWRNSDRLHFTCMDAQTYEAPGYEYQFIFCDLFDGENLVPFVCDPAFAKKLKSMLCDGGFLIVNCGWEENLYQLRKTYQSAFREVQFVDREFWQTAVLLAGDRLF